MEYIGSYLKLLRNFKVLFLRTECSFLTRLFVFLFSKVSFLLTDFSCFTDSFEADLIVFRLPFKGRLVSEIGSGLTLIRLETSLKTLRK